MHDPAALLLFSGIVLLAAATQTLTGFGFSLVGLALMGLWMDLREAVLLIARAGLAQNIFLFLRLRKSFSWSGLVPLVIACLIGVPAGTWFLLNTPHRGLGVTMAVIMIATALHRIWLDRRTTVEGVASRESRCPLRASQRYPGRCVWRRRPAVG